MDKSIPKNASAVTPMIVPIIRSSLLKRNRALITLALAERRLTHRRRIDQARSSALV
jgi:hypothetical protein